MSHDAMSLEQYLVAPERWDLEVPPEVRVEGITDEVERYPVAYGRHPEDGWFVLTCGQGPFVVWAEWWQPRGVVKVTDFDKPTPEPDSFREPLIQVLGRLRATLQKKKETSP